MKKKIVGFFMCMLLMTVTATPVIGIINIDENRGNTSVMNISVSINGILNNASVAGNGTVTINPDNGEVNGAIIFTAIDPVFHPNACAWNSLLCIFCCLGCPSKNSSLSLYTITGGNFEGIQHFKDYYNNSQVMDIDEQVILTKVNDTIFLANVTLNGWYNGPTNLISFGGGYNMSLRQKDVGTLEAFGSCPIYCLDDTIITCNFTRLYQYNTTEVLPFDEVVIYKLVSSSYENQTSVFHGFLRYEPAAIVTIEKPVKGHLYFIDREIIPFPWTFIIGRITIDIKAEAQLGVDRVEFYIDNDLRYTANNTPYEWLWQGLSFGHHTLKIIAFDKEGDNRENQIVVWKFF
jgi:hypothetical protein